MGVGHNWGRGSHYPRGPCHPCWPRWPRHAGLGCMGVAWAALYCHGLPWGGLGWLRLPWAALGWLRLPWGELGCLGLPGGLELPWGGLGCLGVRRLGWSGHTKIIFIFEKIKQIKVNYINSNQNYFEPKGVFVPQVLWAGFKCNLIFQGPNFSV